MSDRTRTCLTEHERISPELNENLSRILFLSRLPHTGNSRSLSDHAWTLLEYRMNVDLLASSASCLPALTAQTDKTFRLLETSDYFLSIS
ncbi:hypothetical protein RRG08_030010 [Elysia crispata]|uniref:Uncharacterized protein n=1 Tax=Elysia crispata TaxID=231223 RepID=A0AAE1CPJ9_9GAST|nr:hypothetical protein RRG08_030010 [Elysia crispata]